MTSTNQSRTANSVRNIKYATIGRVIAILLGYASRVVFTHTLGEDYVGINGLFWDIVRVLSVTELGFGTAISYALYKPIAEGDIEKQKSLMNLYKKFYMIVAGIVAALGLSLVPFLSFFVKGNTTVDHIAFIYLLYLLMTVFSYFCIYKRTLLDANQLSYIGELCISLVNIVQIIIQMIVLILTKNFILYVMLMVFCSIISNLLTSMFADKHYPFLKDKDIKPLDKAEEKDLFKNVKAMLMHKLGEVLINNTDNLLLSSIVGVKFAGMYSNYFLVIESIRIVIELFFTSITGSVGNLGVTENKARVKKIYDSLFFIGQWIYGLFAICIFIVLDIFVSVSFGANYVFAKNITLVLCLNLYVTGMRSATLTFRNTLGLFYYDRYKSIAAAVINLLASIVLGIFYGTIGIFLGTFISTMLTSFWIEPYILYKKFFGSSVWDYFRKYILYAFTTVALGLLCILATSSFEEANIVTFLIRGIISFAIVNLGYLLVYFRRSEFRFLFAKLMAMLKDKRGKR